MAITWSILKLEKCNGYQNLQKNISNYVFFYIISLSLERFLSYFQKWPFLLRPKVSLSVSPYCPMPYSIHFPLWVPFDAVIVFCSGPDLFFKSILTHCGIPFPPNNLSSFNFEICHKDLICLSSNGKHGLEMFFKRIERCRA